MCKLISLEANSCLCLIIKDTELYKAGSEHVKQLVGHRPGILLAEILQTHCLTSKNKVVLASILANSLCKLDASGWINMKWNSQTVHLIEETRGHGRGEKGSLFAQKPYLCVTFNNKDRSDEYSVRDGEVHNDPRVRVLGIMMVEIAIRSPLHATNAGINGDLLLALEYLKDERLWREFDYPDYLSAVNYCLDPGTFNLAASIRTQGKKDPMEGLRQRRNILYNVVLPLKDLLEGTKWNKGLTSMAPLEAHSRTPDLPILSTADNVDIAKPTAMLESAKPSLTKSQKEAEKWLERMKLCNLKLSRDASARVSRNIHIAILDTGCNDNVPFFLPQGNRDRLKAWKDWVDGSHEFEDCHGHGTSIVSLIMKITTNADLYVAQVAKSPKEILGASENVAQVC